MTNPYAGIPSYEDVYGGQYFSPADLHEGAVTAKIIDLKYDEIFCKGVGKNSKIILTLEGQKKRIVVNKTSAKALAFKWGKDFRAWVGKTVYADGGNVNGKAAVLLTPIVERIAQKPVSPIREALQQIPQISQGLGTQLALAATQGTIEEPGANDGSETTNVVFVAITKLKEGSGFDYALLDGTGCNLWRCNQPVYETLLAMKAKDRKVSVTHMMNCIESVKECE